MTKKGSRTKVHENGTVQHDFVEHGSDEHMRFLSLKKAEKGDEPQYKGFALDGEPYGVTGWTPNQLLGMLKQKVSGFLTKPPAVQSEDRDAPGYAPEMWMPHEPGEEVQGII